MPSIFTFFNIEKIESDSLRFRHVVFIKKRKFSPVSPDHHRNYVPGVCNLNFQGFLINVVVSSLYSTHTRLIWILFSFLYIHTVDN
ncbi:hypothetical protein BLA29_005727 [Euroglyphus maynei]|uniref:Uncharacterized protein n=1 Tax=Euroglyphus maynei TaxID=6958 RepID=A0A1Y3AYG5_EURMA|nr:hypothetical protein BLA29_005727 [Euroglyphus maynei]